MIWHGADRHLASSAVLATYDVVITSYAVLESEYRRVQDQHKVACRYVHISTYISYVYVYTYICLYIDR